MKKRIVIIGSNAFDSMEYHLNDAFANMGYDSVIVGYGHVLPLTHNCDYWLKRLSESYDQYVNKKLVRIVSSYEPHIVIGVYRNIHPCLVHAVKINLPKTLCIHINQDQLTTLQRQQILASDYDYYFSKDPFIVDFMKNKANLNAYYLPEAFNPRIHTRPSIPRTFAEDREDIDVLVWGTIYPYRARLIEYLVDSGVNVRIFGRKGPYFPRKLNAYFSNRYLIGEEKNKTLYGARIVLNNYHYAEVESVNVKYFETNGIGAFQLCDYKKILDELSPVDSDLYSFKNVQEAKEKILYYLDKPKERQSIADESHAYFARNHTYENRVETIMGIIKR